MNVYNKKSLKENCNDWTLNRILPYIKLQVLNLRQEHSIKAHKYDICKVQNNICPYSVLKCVNCGENHRPNSPKCEIVKKIIKKYLKKSSSDQKQLDNMNGQV